MFNPKLAADGSWYFDKVFSDDEFIAAGQLVIPPSGRKPSKAAKDNTYVSTALSTSTLLCGADAILRSSMSSRAL